jgi:asparaginyl-tRNA synthetase
MKLNEDEKTVRAMDILVPRLGEIVGGSEREDDYDTLLCRIKELGLEPEDYWWYLELRKYGTIPHSGFGLGFERLIQFATGMKNIRDVIPFPRSYGEAGI